MRRIIGLVALVLGAFLLAPPTARSSCQVATTIQTRCPNGCYVDTTTFHSWPSGEDCYKNQGETIPCPCGDYVFTASVAGMCDTNRNICNWWASPQAKVTKDASRGLLITRVYMPDCDGNLRTLSYQQLIGTPLED